MKLLLVGSTELVGRNGSPSSGSRRRVDDVVAPTSRAGRLRRSGSTKNSRNCRAGNHNCRLGQTGTPLASRFFAPPWLSPRTNQPNGANPSGNWLLGHGGQKGLLRSGRKCMNRMPKKFAVEVVSPVYPMRRSDWLCLSAEWVNLVVLIIRLFPTVVGQTPDRHA